MRGCSQQRQSSVASARHSIAASGVALWHPQRDGNHVVGRQPGPAGGAPEEGHEGRL